MGKKNWAIKEIWETKIKVKERAGDKVVDLLHKSNASTGQYEIVSYVVLLDLKGEKGVLRIKICSIKCTELLAKRKTIKKI